MIPHISHQSLRLNIRRVRSQERYLSSTHDDIVRGDVGVAEAGDVGLAGVDVDLVLLLSPLANLTVLRDCLLAFLASLLHKTSDQNIRIVFNFIKQKRNRVDGSDHKIYYIYQHVGHVGLLLNLLCYYFVSIFCLN